MSQVPFQITRGMAETMREIPESWKEYHDDAIKARDVEEMVVECFKLNARMKEHLRTIANGVTEDSTADHFANAVNVFGLLQIVLTANEVVATAIQSMNALGYQIERQDELFAEQAKLTQASDWIKRNWYIPNETNIAESRLQIQNDQGIYGIK